MTRLWLESLWWTLRGRLADVLGWNWLRPADWWSY